MASSRMEFYRRDKHGRINIDWHGTENGGNDVIDQAYKALKQIETVLIIAQTDPTTSATCLRMICNIVRKAKNLGVETRVVIPNEQLFNAADTTGFNEFYTVFPSEAAALDDLNSH